jgi:hypothetical protein
MELFLWLHFRENRRNASIRFLFFFQLALFLFFLLGFLFRAADWYQALKLYPHRLFPIFVVMFFFLALLHAYRNWPTLRFRSSLALGALVTLPGLAGNPVAVFVDELRESYLRWHVQHDEILKTFRWIAANTPNGSIAILPPWREDSWYYAERGQIACWRHPRVDRLSEWRERMLAMVGNAINAREQQTLEIPTFYREMEKAYNDLTARDIMHIVQRYGGDYLVSKASYPFAVLYDTGTYKVYAIQ